MMASKALPFIYCAFGAGSFYSANYQFNQKKQNDGYFSRMNKRISSEPIECPTKLSYNELNNIYKYRSVSITGIMDKSNSIIMGNYIYSPLKTERGQIIIVNRGWISKKNIKKYIQQNININNHIQHQKMEKFHGTISTKDLSPFFESYLKKNNSLKINKSIHSTIWQFKGEHYKKSKRINSMKTDTENIDCIVVDLIESKHEMNEQYEPHRLSKNDIYGMIDVEKQKQKHIQYAMSFIFAGIACFGYSYYLMRIPRGFQRINTTQLWLNNPLKIKFN